jgi:serine/threonine-protein kinase
VPEQIDDPLLGTDVGGYRVESVIGIGGMGRVYRATGPDGTPVALKLVKADLAGDQIFRRRFDREVRIALRVNHPNVVPVLDAGEQDGIPFLVQRLITSGTLDERLKANGPLGLQDAARACTDIAAGLDAVYAAGLVHRDVKPANILLDDQGGAHITDFGLSKDLQGSVLTRPGQALGSMDYMAPEQIRGDAVTAATDVYALGCVMQECLTGAPPFATRTGMHVLWAHLQDDPPDVSEERPELAGDVARAVRHALDKNPTKRPQTAGDFAREFQAAASASIQSTS